MVDQVAHEQRRVGVVLGHEVGHAVALVDLVAAQVGGAHVLAHDVAHDGRAGEEHVPALGHDHEVGQRRRVGAAAGGGAADHGDLRDLAAQAHVLLEDPGVPGEGREALLHARAAGLDEAHHGRAGAAGEPQHADDRVGVLLAQRAAEVRRVLRVAEHGAPVDAPGAGDHAVAGAGLLAHPPGADVGAQQRERAAIAERLEALDGTQSIGVSLELDGHGASRQRTALWPPKPNAFESATAGWPLTSSVRASLGT